MTCPNGMHRFQMVGKKAKGAEVSTGWNCTQARDGEHHDRNAVVGCWECCAGWCVEHIPTEQPKSKVRR